MIVPYPFFLTQWTKSSSRTLLNSLLSKSRGGDLPRIASSVMGALYPQSCNGSSPSLACAP
jgi:hypothetical protein